MAAGGASAVVGAGAVLRRRGVVVVLAVGDDAAGVLVPLRLLDDQVPAGVGARVAERRVLGVRVGEPRVAVRTRAHVVGRVAHVARVGVLDQPRPVHVAREDAVLAAGRVLAQEHGRRRREIGAVVAVQVHGAGAVATVPPDLVAAAAGAGQEVACGQVLDRDAVHLEHLDAVAARRVAVPVERAQILRVRARIARRRAGLGAVDDHLVAVEAAQVEVRLRDQHGAGGVAAGQRVHVVAALVVVAGGDQDPVAGARGVDRLLDRREVARPPVRRADAEHGGGGGGSDEGEESGGEPARESRLGHGQPA